MDPTHHCPANPKLITSPEFAKEDYSDGITDTKCLNWPPYPDKPIVCHRGDTTSPKKRIALFGNSHAGQWVEAMGKIGRKNHWQVDTYIVGNCYSTFDPSPEFCDKIMGDSAAALLAGDYDLVVMSTLDRADTSSAEMYVPTIQQATATGANVLVIRDTPAPSDPSNVTPDCVAAHLDDPSACAGTPKKWIGVDFLTAAAKLESADPAVTRVNINRYLCRKGDVPGGHRRSHPLPRREPPDRHVLALAGAVPAAGGRGSSFLSLEPARTPERCGGVCDPALGQDQVDLAVVTGFVADPQDLDWLRSREVLTDLGTDRQTLLPIALEHLERVEPSLRRADGQNSATTTNPGLRCIMAAMPAMTSASKPWTSILMRSKTASGRTTSSGAAGESRVPRPVARLRVSPRLESAVLRASTRSPAERARAWQVMSAPDDHAFRASTGW